MKSPHSPLALYLAVAYALLVAYASLHPLSGWRDTGAPLLDFLSAPWPRYHTGFDLAANILAYVPLGFLIVPALQGRLGIAAAALLAALAGGGLSLALETLQNFLPSRVPSNIDLACNAIGAMIGAAAGAMRRTSAWCCSACGCSPSSTRNCCCSAPATCAPCSSCRRCPIRRGASP